jgi:hypothetical protein
MRWKQILYLLVIAVSILPYACSPKDRPSNSDVIDIVLAGEQMASPEVVLSRKINLDEDPELEALFLIRNGTQEILSTFKFENQAWAMTWKKSFSLMNIGPLVHSETEGRWNPSSEVEKNQGFIVKKILAEELAGDSFNSIFIEVMSEEPPLGLFSIPMGYRKGAKILDGLSLFKDHPRLIQSKRTDFLYKPEDKSILIFPKDRPSSIEFVFNGWEMIPNISSQPIPALISSKKTGNRYRLEFKNRGGYSTVTYLTLSFPLGGKLKPISTSGLRVYQKADSIYSRVKMNNIPAEYPMLEVTKEGWGTNVRYAFEFEYEPNTSSDPRSIDVVNGKNTGIAPYFLFRTSYRYNRQVETIPNEFSVYATRIDQQGFPAYTLPLPEEKD